MVKYACSRVCGNSYFQLHISQDIQRIFQFFQENVVFYRSKCNIFSDKSDSRISDVCSFVCPIGAFQLVLIAL